MGMLFAAPKRHKQALEPCQKRDATLEDPQFIFDRVRGLAEARIAGVDTP
jgi:hypothetical protein